MKDDMDSKLTTKFAFRPKVYAQKIQKDDYEKKNSKLKKAIGVQKPTFKNLTFGVLTNV